MSSWRLLFPVACLALACQEQTRKRLFRYRNEGKEGLPNRFKTTRKEYLFVALTSVKKNPIGLVPEWPISANPGLNFALFLYFTFLCIS